MSQHNSLSDYLPLLNQQIASHSLLSEYLFQMEALFHVALTSDRLFLHYKKKTIHYYLAVINDIVFEAKNFNEQQLNNLIKLASLMNKPDPSSGGETVH